MGSADAIRAETITITGHNGDEIEAYSAVPLAPGSRGGVVWIHHMPGYDRETKEFVRRLAVAGYHPTNLPIIPPAGVTWPCANSCCRPWTTWACRWRPPAHHI